MDEKALVIAIKAAKSQAYNGRSTAYLVREAIQSYLEASGIQKDAERYRWIRDSAKHYELDSLVVVGSSEFDSAVDGLRGGK